MKASTLLHPFLTAALSLVPFVHAHGFVYVLGIDGKDYKGNVPEGSSDTPSPIRQVNSQDPIYGSTSPTVNCGNGAPNAALVVDAMPGSRLSWDWREEDLAAWPHDIGPMLTYLASCGSTTCDQFDARTAKWFKIDQVGQDGNGGWVQKQLMTGAVYNATLPNNLAPGQYLIRHEIIALHLANEKGKAEFYPSCQQINVGGNGTGVPSPDELMTFPGAYSDDDPGLFTPGVFDPGFNYTFPGGPIATLIDGGNNNGTSTSVSPSSTRKPRPSTSVMSSPVPTGTGTPDDSGPSSCSLKKNKTLLKRSNVKNSRSDRPRPHHVSRVMGKLLHGSNL